MTGVDAAIPAVHSFSTTYGNELTLFSDYEPWIDRLLVDITAATTEIVMEMYIFEDDGEGREVAEALKSAVARGVKVRLMYDGLGCERVSGSFFTALEAAGIELRVYNPLEPWSKWYKSGLPLRRRNHRKLLVIDRRIGHLGGMNLSGRFRYWQDMMLRLEGPVVLRLRESHEAVWTGRYRKLLSLPWPRKNIDIDIRVLDNFASDQYSPIKGHYLNAIKAAQKRILLAHAYFFPDKKIRKYLRKAARRGVSVEVVAPEKSDIAAVDFAARHTYGRLLRDGIRLYLYQGGMLHAKAAVIDDTWTTIGSANLDPISLFSCLELNVGITHQPLAAAVTSIIEGYKTESTLITRENWKKRSWMDKLFDWVWYRLRRWYATWG